MEFDGNTTLEVDNEMNLVVNVPDISISSEMPKDIKDLQVTLFIGPSDTRVVLAEMDIGTVPAGSSMTHKAQTFKIPVVPLFLSIGDFTTADHKLDLTLSAEVGVKYADWMGMTLLDMDIVVNTNTKEITKATISDPVVSGNSVGFSVSCDDGVLANIIQEFYNTTGGGATVTCDDMAVSIDLPVWASHYNMSVMAYGMSAPPYEILENKLATLGEGEKLTFDYVFDNGTAGTFSLTKAQVQKLIDVLEDLFTKGAAE